MVIHQVFDLMTKKQAEKTWHLTGRDVDGIGEYQRFAKDKGQFLIQEAPLTVYILDKRYLKKTKHIFVYIRRDP